MLPIRASRACGPAEIPCYQRSAPCTKRVLTPVYAKPAFRRNEGRFLSPQMLHRQAAVQSNGRDVSGLIVPPADLRVAAPSRAKLVDAQASLDDCFGSAADAWRGPAAVRFRRILSVRVGCWRASLHRTHNGRTPPATTLWVRLLASVILLETANPKLPLLART